MSADRPGGDDAVQDDAVGGEAGEEPTGDSEPSATDTDSGADDRAPSDGDAPAEDGGDEAEDGRDRADDGGDKADEDIEERDPYKRRVAIVLALLGVVGAWIGILHNDSSNSEATYARDTTRAAVASLRANVNQSTIAGLGLDLDAEQATLGLGAAFGIDREAAQAEATLTEASAGIDAQDREILERELTTEAESQDLTRTALAETRVTYNNRTSQYETVLTTLAVALFLVGFTLVLHRRVRPPVLVPGLLLAAYVAGWAVWIHQRPIPTTDPAAIELAAQATTNEAFGDFQQAQELYTEAIAVDDDFRSAYTGRSIAAFLAANPDFTRTLAVVEFEGELVDQAFADAEEAIELGQGKDFNALVVSGIYRFYDEDYDGAVDRLTEATEVNDRAPEAFLLLTAAELARGDTAAADEALEDGVALLDTDAANAGNREFAAILFSLLEQVEAAVPERAEEIDEVRTNLAAGESGLVFGEEMSGAEVPGASFGLGEVTYVDGELTSNFEYEGLPAGTPVTVYIYEQPAEGAAFVQAAELARFAPLEGSGSISGTVDLERVCQPVAFRYDVYVNGTPAASLDAPGTEPTC